MDVYFTKSEVCKLLKIDTDALSKILVNQGIVLTYGKNQRTKGAPTYLINEHQLEVIKDVCLESKTYHKKAISSDFFEINKALNKYGLDCSLSILSWATGIRYDKVRRIVAVIKKGKNLIVESRMNL
jgi:hypothetical protein